MNEENEYQGRGIRVSLPVFEGPLDLLLHLIEKNKIDIYDIPIVTVTDQYMEYISQMDHEDLGVMSDFLVMAATLLEIKAAMLLPKEENEEEEEETDPREELARRLAEYKLYKELSCALRENGEAAALSFYRDPDIPGEVMAYVPPKDPKELLEGVDVQKLLEVFGDVQRRLADKVDPVRSGFGDIEREEVSLDEKMELVTEILGKNGRTSFRSVLTQGGTRTRMQVIVTFLAVLELMKAGKMKAVQEETFGEIYLEEAGET